MASRTRRRASQDDIEEIAELWGVDEDDVRALARKHRVSVLDLIEASFKPAPKAKPSRPVRAPSPEPRAVQKSIPARETRVSPEESEPVELDDDELDEYAELWGVDPADVEALAEELDMAPDEMSRDEVREYIDDLYDALVDEGWELDVSDLWDMYYGYAPGGKAA